MQRLARLDLARAALVAAVLELAFDRIAPAVAERRPHALELVGQFSRHFSGILCVFVLAWTVGLTLGRRDVFAAPARTLFGLIGIILSPLLAWAAVAPVPPWLIPQIEISFLFLAVACIYAALRTSGDTRTTTGIAVLAVPLLARGYSIAAGSYEVLAFGRLDARQLAEHLGEAAALIAGIAAPLLLPPRAQARLLARRPPLVAAFVVTMAVTAVAVVNLPLVQNGAQALGFALPEEPAGRLVYMVALFGTVWTLAALLPARGPARLVGTGFALISVSGYSLVRTSELAATALGFLLVVWGESGAESLDPAPPLPEIDAEKWLADARGLANRLGGECVIVNDDDRQITRASGRQGPHSVVVRVVRENGFDHVDVVVGHPPGDGTFDIEVAERPGAQDAPSFDERYRVRGTVAESTRTALGPLGGTTQVWSGRGARWRHRVPSPVALDRLDPLPKTLASLI